MTKAPLRTFSYGVLLFLLCYCLETLFTFSSRGLIDATAIDNAMYITLGAKFCACLLALGFVAARGRDELAAAGFTAEGAGRDCLSAIGLYLLFLPFFVFVIAPLNNLLVGEEQQAIVREIMDRPDLLKSLPFLATVCVGVPVLEEIVFRSFLYQGLRFHLPFLAAVMVSGAVFGVLHGLAAAIPIMTLGCLLGYLREKSCSLLPVVLVHAIHNSWTVLSIHILDALDAG